jgi:hypothetical protein
MRFLRPLLAAGAGAALLSGAAQAQLPAISYSHHYHPNANLVGVAFSGPFLFTPAGASINFASDGDALRRCLSVDSTQGGRNQSTGNYETTMFRVAQGWQAGNSPAGVTIGLVSMQASSESDVTGDACFGPFLSSPSNTGGHKLSAAAVIGNIAGTVNPTLANGGAFPTVWTITFQWTGTTTTFQGPPGAVSIGTASLGGFNNPLLVNQIMEVQGPVNGSQSTNQYYLGTTTEQTGTGAGSPTTGTGGVTNGNALHGSGIFAGATADVSGAISYSRVIASITVGGSPFIAFYAPAVAGVVPGHVELQGYTGMQSPGLWAINNGSEGAGGPDWQVSQAPISTVNVRMNDHLAGAQINNDKNNDGVPGDATAAFSPCFVPAANFAFFVYCASGAVNMVGRPESWDDLGGAIPAQAGSVIIGAQATSRQGPQTIPINFDPVTVQFLGFSTLSFGTPFTTSNDLFLDTPGAQSSHLQGTFSNITSGISTWSGGTIPAIGTANPALAGFRIGVAAAGVQLSICTGLAGLSEVANALTIVLQ